jgi:hypothetical protein
LQLFEKEMLHHFRVLKSNLRGGDKFVEKINLQKLFPFVFDKPSREPGQQKPQTQVVKSFGRFKFFLK